MLNRVMASNLAVVVMRWTYPLELFMQTPPTLSSSVQPLLEEGLVEGWSSDLLQGIRTAASYVE